MAEATGLLQAAGLTVYVIDDVPGLVVTRTVAMLVNGAVDARNKGVASAADIDTAMQFGTNYPLGPLAWGQSWGPAAVLAVLDAMHAWYGEDRYRPSALLRRSAAAGTDLGRSGDADLDQGELTPLGCRQAAGSRPADLRRGMLVGTGRGALRNRAS